jgi:hypothetical protein
VSKGSSNGRNEQQRRTFSLDRLHETPAGPGQREIRVEVGAETGQGRQGRAGQGDDRDSKLLRNHRNAHTGLGRVLLPPHLFALGRGRRVMVGVRQHRRRLVHGALGCMGMGVGRWWRNEGPLLSEHAQCTAARRPPRWNATSTTTPRARPRPHGETTILPFYVSTVLPRYLARLCPALPSSHVLHRQQLTQLTHVRRLCPSRLAPTPRDCVTT